MSDNNQPLTDEDLKMAAELLGRKLAILIASLNISPQAKTDLANVAMLLNPKQFSELTEILENLSAHEATLDIDKQLEQQVAEIQDRYAKKIKQINDEAMSAILEIEKQIPQD